MKSIDKKIKRLVEDNQVKTITLDVFDTILMRKVWPEDQQFITVADKWLPYFREIISPEITRDKLYSWRQYARDELFRAQYELSTERQESNGEFDISLELWFGHLIDLMINIYAVKLLLSERKRLLDTMIAIEMEVEKESLKPNIALIETIRSIKHNNPDIKVYFLSDMYLGSDEIKELLGHFEIDIFDNGVSSMSVGLTKHSGGMFYGVHKTSVLDESFSIFDNLHIGDNEHSDHKMARQAGSMAFLYHPYRFRRLRTKIGSAKVALVRRSMQKRDLKKLENNIETDYDSPRQVWQSFGALFSQPLYTFLLHTGTVAHHNPKVNFIMVSSEARMFDRLGKKLFPGFYPAKNIIVADKLNRRMMLRALVWYLSQSDDSRYNAEAIFKTVCLGEVDGSRREVYSFFFGEEFPASELILKQRSEKEFLKGFFDDIRTADVKFTKHLRDAYSYVAKLLPKNNTPTVVIDVGWGGTVQVLFSQFSKLHGITQEVEGLYLGVHPFDRFEIKAPRAVGYLLPNVRAESRGLWNAIIWEYAYTNKPQFSEDAVRLGQIQIGFERGATLFKNIETNPKVYFDKLVSPKIKRLISKPTRYEVQTIGSIRFDCGFVDEGIFRIVNMDLPQKRISLGLIRHPKAILHQTAFVQNAWVAGYMKYYRMYGVKTILRIVGYLRGKRYV